MIKNKNKIIFKEEKDKSFRHFKYLYYEVR